MKPTVSLLWVPFKLLNDEEPSSPPDGHTLVQFEVERGHFFDTDFRLPPTYANPPCSASNPLLCTVHHRNNGERRMRIGGAEEVARIVMNAPADDAPTFPLRAVRSFHPSSFPMSPMPPCAVPRFQIQSFALLPVDSESPCIDQHRSCAASPRRVAIPDARIYDEATWDQTRNLESAPFITPHPTS